MMARAGGQLAITHAAQHPAQRLFADRNAELREHPLRQIGQPHRPCGSPPGARETLFESRRRGGVLGVMARPGGELAVAHRAQHPAERLRADRNAELGIDPLRQINQTPAHHHVHRRIGAGLDDPPQGLALLRVQKRPVARRLAVEKPRRPMRVEDHHPLAHS